MEFFFEELQGDGVERNGVVAAPEVVVEVADAEGARDSLRVDRHLAFGAILLVEGEVGENPVVALMPVLRLVFSSIA